MNRTLPWTAYCAAAVALLMTAPVILVRVFEVGGSINPLHRQAMPVLELGSWSVLWPPEVLRLLGPVGILGLVVVALTRSFPTPASRYGAAASLAAVGLTLVPGLFDAAHRTTSSLPIKMLYAVPFFWVLAGFLP